MKHPIHRANTWPAYLCLLTLILCSLFHLTAPVGAQESSQTPAAGTDASLAELGSDDAIWIITDPHYLSPSLFQTGQAMERLQASAAGKDLYYGRERMEALVYQVQASRPKLLLVSGDLTFNGEYQSAVDLASYFDQIEALGTSVLVIPGNHDIADGWARGYTSQDSYRVQQITRDDFAQLFANHGYLEASDRDPASLSYLAKPFNKVWFLMIDSNRYKETGEDTQAPRTNGLVRKETLAWMDQQLQQAQEAGATIIPVIHHNVIDHHALLTSGFTVDNAPDVRAILAKHPQVVLGFSGHIHTQHIAQETLSPKQTYTEIVNGAFSVYPASIGVLHLDATDYHYERQQLAIDQWAAASQQSNPDLVQHTAYLRQLFEDISRSMVTRSLENESWAQGNLSQELADIMGPLNIAYFSGEALDPQWLKEQVYASPAYQTLLSQAPRDHFLLRYLQSILAENQDCDHLKFDLPRLTP